MAKHSMVEKLLVSVFRTPTLAAKLGAKTTTLPIAAAPQKPAPPDPPGPNTFVTLAAALNVASVRFRAAEPNIAPHSVVASTPLCKPVPMVENLLVVVLSTPTSTSPYGGK